MPISKRFFCGTGDFKADVLPECDLGVSEEEVFGRGLVGLEA